MAGPTAREFVLDLLSTRRHGGAMPVGALVAAAALLGIRGNTLRVALARLLGEGLVARDARGEYGLGPHAAFVRQVRSWRDLPARTRRWSGSWVGVHLGGLGQTSRTGLRRRAHALGALGFRALRPGLWLRPDNLAGGVAAVREQLHLLGLDGGASVFGMTDLTAADRDRARRLWRVAHLATAYRAARSRLERSETRLPRLPQPAAMTETFRLGGHVIRLLARDPLLPAELSPEHDRDRLVEAMQRYDRAGRRLWVRFLGRYGVRPHPHAPADLRLRLIAGSRR